MSDESAFRAIAHPARRRVLDLLRNGEKPVADIFTTFKMSKQAFSQHLRILRTAGLVDQRRDGRQRVYRLNAAKLRDVIRWVGPPTTPSPNERRRRPTSRRIACANAYGDENSSR